MTALRIYLADLTHVGRGVATEAFPLNVGLIGSYIKKLYGTAVDVSLYKLPIDLKEAIRDRPPHVLACSNYTWNCKLSCYFCELVKSMDANIITVFGGTNYPFFPKAQESFLSHHPAVDAHIFYEGEQAFANLVQRILSNPGAMVLGEEPIAGCQFIDRRSARFVDGGALPRMKDLDAIPSPYVAGLLDKFFDGQLTPLVETARGCPFLCNFCNAGDRYFNKVNLFSDDYVREELGYIARKAAGVGITHLTLADNNFGMIPRDARTAEVIYDLQRSHGWPRSMSAWTGKNSKERVIQVTRLLGETFSISMSVQSMDEDVLQKIGRDNIKLDHYRKIAQELNDQGRPQHAEVILPLPGETLRSHIHGLNELLDSGVSRVLSHTLQMLHGTPYKDDEAYRADHAFRTKFRIVPLDFTKIDETCIFDVEEVAVASNTLSFEEYVQTRKYLLVIDLCHNSEVFAPLKKYLQSRGIPISTWIQAIFGAAENAQGEVKRIFNSFEQETVSELWDTEEELVSFYSRPENYEKLLNYDAGGNVLFKHRVWMLSTASRQWIEFVLSCTERFLEEKVSPGEKKLVTEELSNIKDYISYSTVDCFSPESLDQRLEKSFRYDIPAWLAARGDNRLSEHAAPSPVVLEFYFSDWAITVMRDGFRRYSSDLAGLIKLIQRIPGISFGRTVGYQARPEKDPVGNGQARPTVGPGWSSL